MHSCHSFPLCHYPWQNVAKCIRAQQHWKVWTRASNQRMQLIHPKHWQQNILHVWIMQRLIKSPPCTSDTGNRKVAVPCFPPLHHGAQQVTGMEGHWQKPKYDIGCKKHGGNPHRDVKEMESHLFPSRSYQYIDIGLRLLMPWVLGPSNHSSKWT